MRTLLRTLSVLLTGALAAPAATRIEQNEPPQIAHFPTITAFRGQPVPVYAQVTDRTGRIKTVSLFYALSEQQAPIEVRMKRVGGDRYSGLIPANFFAAASKVWYFIEARDSFDDKAETTWFPVAIKDPDTEPTQSENAPAENATRTAGTKSGAARTADAGTAGSAGPSGQAFPQGAVATSTAGGGGIGVGTVVGGVLIAGGIGAAVSSGGGDDGGGGGGGGFDPGSAVIVNASGAASGGFAGGPQDEAVDGSGAVAGKSVTGVRCTLDYQAFSIADRFQILYQGGVIADSGLVSGSGSIQGTAGGGSAQVVIRVLTPSGGTAWNWSATLEISAR